ncbi:PhzF family phenazine biosynthesis protein [Pseudoruegeria sp. HB172150]|uniref:PhzF family phenazine biosynthesis protein n=1 Tax=Pseudoruegeria sp. HB172150 TaxID=2721164 RepID=UPI001551848B|nr:PhzF family phenazine biosynthesis protein [Pseudoruegeria sp. HB172150]
MPLEFDWVDAFSPRPFGGNGCAVVHGAEGLSGETCMAFVRETGLVECTFLGPSELADMKVRYFMADQEIPFAGHPTLATVASMVDRGLVAEKGITLETAAGLIPIALEFSANSGPTITMTQNTPEFGAGVPLALVADLGGLEIEDILGLPRVVSTGLPFCIVVLKDKDALRRVKLNLPLVEKFRKETGVLEPFWVTLGGATEAGCTFSRLVLAPPLPPEDPFTGSATGAMAAYLWSEGLIEEPVFVAEQGHWMGRPGQAQVEVLGPRDAITGVRVGGQAHVLMRGSLSL